MSPGKNAQSEANLGAVASRDQLPGALWRGVSDTRHLAVSNSHSAWQNGCLPCQIQLSFLYEAAKDRVLKAPAPALGSMGPISPSRAAGPPQPVRAAAFAGGMWGHREFVRAYIPSGTQQDDRSWRQKLVGLKRRSPKGF